MLLVTPLSIAGNACMDSAETLDVAETLDAQNDATVHVEHSTLQREDFVLGSDAEAELQQQVEAVDRASPGSEQINRNEIELLTATTQAAQHQNAHLYAFWNFNGCCYWNLDQEVMVAIKAPFSYWAMNWNWAFLTSGGYMGLQTDGTRFDGTRGDTAIFSLWNANGVRGGSCGSFSGEGSGYSCRRAFTIHSDRFYRLRVWRQERDTQGRWWAAYVLDTATGVEYPLGGIRVAGDFVNLIGGIMNFSEYYGGAVSCDAVPISWALFTAPAGNSLGGGKYQFGSLYAGGYRGPCTGGAVTMVNPIDTPLGRTHAASILQGGKR